MLLIDPKWQFRLSGDPPTKPVSEEKKLKFLPKVIIYTDGSKKNQDRDNAYWAWIAYDPLGRRLFQQKGHVKGSAQTAEIEAFMKALAWADRKKFRDIKIISDSKYVVEGFDQNLDIWRQTNFQTHKGKELEHMEKWIVISQLAQRKRIWVEHIHSHRPVTDEKGKGNQEVDKLAQLRHAGALLETRAAYVPKSWYHEGKVVVPEEEMEGFIKMAHETLGHAGQERITRWFKRQGILIPGWKEKYQEIKRACERCALKGGMRESAD
ncbi:hypothetical protein NQD34_018240 [Periophthalmus magnuspinnatus]|nr:hypothetical protein NQD34_018240 [Periophthalmus magnuspinnatus]